MRLTLDLDQPVTLAEMRTVAREILDALRRETLGARVDPPFAEAHLRCPEIQRSIRRPVDPPEPKG